MANRFFRFLTPFVAGTTVRSGAVNARFGEVEVGFERVEAAVNRQLRVHPSATHGSLEIPNVTLTNGMLFFDQNNNVTVFPKTDFDQAVANTVTASNNAITARNEAVTAKNQAETAQQGAATSRGVAQTKATEAQASATKAGQYANHPEGTLIPGSTTEYSAKHWYEKTRALGQAAPGNYVPQTRTVNGKALSADITLTKADLGLGNVPNVVPYHAGNKPNKNDVALGNVSNYVISTTFVGGRSNVYASEASVKAAYDQLNSQKVPATRRVNSKPLSADINLTAADVGALPTGGTAANANTLDGYNRATVATPNTVAARDSAGDLRARLFRSEYDTTNSSVNFIMTQVDTATNNFIRPTTPAQFRAAVIDPHYSKTYVRCTDGNRTITRQGKVTVEGHDDTANRTLTVGAGFQNNDIVQIKKLLSSGLLTITSTSGAIHLPDGTNGTSHTISNGLHGTVELMRDGSIWRASIY